VQTGSEKLKDRARRILTMVTGADAAEANRLLRVAKWNVKAAIIMSEAGVSYSQALRQLRKADDSIRQALGKDLELNLAEPKASKRSATTA
jgi:N-acetylmuramic acid 6-phosphate (MurNAc-6-P) etherase